MGQRGGGNHQIIRPYADTSGWRGGTYNGSVGELEVSRRWNGAYADNRRLRSIGWRGVRTAPAEEVGP